MIEDAAAAAIQALHAAQRVLLACHVNPDGDAMGSALALGAALRENGIEVTYVCADDVPALYRFMPGADSFVRSVPDVPFDVAVALDCDGVRRLGTAGPGVLQTPCIIEIDHHTGTERFGHILLVDPTAAATAILVFELLGLLHLPVSAAMATNLYVGILTDTGSFRFANTDARALRVCAELVERGADPFEIAERVYENRSLSATLLLGRALNSLRLSEDGKIASARLSAADFHLAGANDSETEGIVNYLRAIAGVQIALLLRETNGKVRVSLRSREPIDVAAVARQFGGGGHRSAAGCTLEGPLDEAEKRICAAARSALRATP